MNDPVTAVERSVDTLITALDGLDAAGIIRATEDLAATVARIAHDGGTARHPLRDTAAIDAALSRLEAAAIRVNVLGDWTRQKLDRHDRLRGMVPALPGRPQKYKAYSYS